MAARWLAGYVFHLGPQYLNEFVPKVSEVTPEAVLQAVAKDFDLGRLTIVVAGDGSAVTKSLAEAKLTHIRHVSVKELL